MINKKVIRYSLAIIGLFSILTLAFSLADTSPHHSDIYLIMQTVNEDTTTETKLNTEDQPPVTMYMYGILEKLSYDELKSQSNVVLIGTVKEELPSKWNTSDGERPNKSIEDLDVGGKDFVYTDVVILVDQYLMNSLDSKEVTVRVIGGTVGKDVFEVEDEPSFKQNEKVLLYIRGENSPFEVTGALQGKFHLTDDGMAVGSDEIVRLDKLVEKISS